MSKIQQKLVRILREKKRLIGVDGATVKRWETERSSPSLYKFEQVCRDNGIELPFFFDGRIESLVAFNKEIGEKMGFRVEIKFD